MSASRFLITGLPRSRTGWLANLFTYGPSFCLHDGLQYHPSELLQIMDGIAAANPHIRHIGNSDSGVPYLQPNGLFPVSKTIVVLRDLQEAKDSFVRYFKDRPYPQMPVGWDGDLWNLDTTFDKFSVALHRLMEQTPAESLCRVTFEALEDPRICEKLWNFIVPEQPFCRARWEVLDKLRVDPASQKVRCLWV